MTLAATPLTLQDLEAAPKAPVQASVVARIRDSHHALARLLAQGVKPVEISAILGYDPGYISKMQSDPAFIELMDHYRSVAQSQFANAAERLGNLALDTVQEIHQRLVEDPAQFTPTQLTELAKTMLDRTGFGPTKTLNTTNLHVSATPEMLQRVRERKAQSAKGQVKQIGQEDKAPVDEAIIDVSFTPAPAADLRPEPGSAVGGAPELHPEGVPAREPSEGDQV